MRHACAEQCDNRHTSRMQAHTCIQSEIAHHYWCRSAIVHINRNHCWILPLSVSRFIHPHRVLGISIISETHYFCRFHLTRSINIQHSLRPSMLPHLWSSLRHFSLLIFPSLILFSSHFHLILSSISVSLSFSLSLSLCLHSQTKETRLLAHVLLLLGSWIPLSFPFFYFRLLCFYPLHSLLWIVYPRHVTPAHIDASLFFVLSSFLFLFFSLLPP